MHARERAASEMHYNLRELAHEHPPTSARLRAASEMNAMKAAAQVATMAGTGQGRGGERGQSLGMEWGDMRSTISGVGQGGVGGGRDRRVDVSERNAYSGKREGACTSSVHSELVCVNGDGEVLGVMLLQSLSPKFGYMYIMQQPLEKIACCNSRSLSIACSLSLSPKSVSKVCILCKIHL
jgi:hypothetical protein